MLTDIGQLLISGLALGGVYTLLAMGLFLTFSTSRALNFGQGDFLALGAFLGMAGLSAGVPLVWVVCGAAMVIVVMGVSLEVVAVKPMLKMKSGGTMNLGWILTTLGFGMIIQNSISMIWGKSRHYSPPLFSSRDQQFVSVGGVNFSIEEIAIALVALILVTIMYFLLYKSNWGKRVAAVSFDQDTAQLLGINVGRVVTGSYVVMALLSALAGILAGPLLPVESHMGMTLLLKAFAVASIGGFSNPLGLLIGGISFGVIEAFSNYVDSSFGDLYPFAIVLIFLVFFPMGLFREKKTDVR